MISGDFGTDKGPIICLKFREYKESKILFSSTCGERWVSAWDVETDNPSKISQIKLKVRCHSFVVRNRLLFCSMSGRPLTLLEFTKSRQLKYKAKFQIHKIHAFSIDKTIQASANGRVVYFNDMKSKSLIGLSLVKLKSASFLSQSLSNGRLQNVNYSCLTGLIFVQFRRSKFAVFSTESNKVFLRKDSKIECIHSSQFLFKDKYLCLGYSNGAMVILDLIKREMRYSLKGGHIKTLTLASLLIPKEDTEFLFIGSWSTDKFYIYPLKSSQISHLKITKE